MNFSGVKKIIELFFNLLSFDATVNYRDTYCGGKVHGVVLNYRLIGCQPPFCVFDDAFNLSVLSFEHCCLIYDFLSLHYT